MPYGPGPSIGFYDTQQSKGIMSAPSSDNEMYAKMAAVVAASAYMRRAVANRADMSLLCLLPGVAMYFSSTVANQWGIKYVVAQLQSFDPDLVVGALASGAVLAAERAGAAGLADLANNPSAIVSDGQAFLVGAAGALAAGWAAEKLYDMATKQ